MKMNKEITEESHCIIDGIPLSESEIALIRAVRSHRVLPVLGEQKEQFNTSFVDNDDRFDHLGSCVNVNELLDIEQTFTGCSKSLRTNQR